MEFEQGSGQSHGSFLQGLTGGIGPGDHAQEALECVGAAQLLQVTDQAEGAISSPLPAQLLPALQLHGDRHLLSFASKAE
jgi:hypothetical protein